MFLLSTTTQSGVRNFCKNVAHKYLRVFLSFTIIFGLQVGILSTAQAGWGPSGVPKTEGAFWQSITSSADGSKLAAVEYGGYISTSSDFGVTWIQRRSPGNQLWNWIASNSEGRILVATVEDGDIYTSSNFGATWGSTSAGIKKWSSISISDDGSVIAATVDAGGIYISLDSGSTWTHRATNASWRTVVLSSSGKYLIAAGAGSGLWTSDNFGETWTARLLDLSTYTTAVTTSADGQKLAAFDLLGGVWISDSFGETWTERVIGDGDYRWLTSASSSNGEFLAAQVQSKGLFTSMDFGITWKQIDHTAGDGGVALSADGEHLVAASSDIWTNNWTNLSFPCSSGGSYEVIYSGIRVGDTPTSGGKLISASACAGAVVIDSSVETITPMVLSNMPNLETLTIGEGVRNLEAAAFPWNPRLTTVVIGSHVSSIGAGLFADDLSLASITYYGLSNPDSATVVAALLLNPCGSDYWSDCFYDDPSYVNTWVLHVLALTDGGDDDAAAEAAARAAALVAAEAAARAAALSAAEAAAAAQVRAASAAQARAAATAAVVAAAATKELESFVTPQTTSTTQSAKPAPTLATYISAGVSGVSAMNLELVNALVKDLGTTVPITTKALVEVVKVATTTLAISTITSSAKVIRARDLVTVGVSTIATKDLRGFTAYLASLPAGSRNTPAEIVQAATAFELKKVVYAQAAQDKRDATLAAHRAVLAEKLRKLKG